MPIIPERNFTTIGGNKVICDSYEFCKGALADDTVCTAIGTPGRFIQNKVSFTTGTNTGSNRICRTLETMAGNPS